MKGTSITTLMLLVALLALVVVYQCGARASPVETRPVWLADVPPEPEDPNAVEDPNEPAGLEPESLGPQNAWVWLEEEPDDPNGADPNDPEEPEPEHM